MGMQVRSQEVRELTEQFLQLSYVRNNSSYQTDNKVAHAKKQKDLLILFHIWEGVECDTINAIPTEISKSDLLN